MEDIASERPSIWKMALRAVWDGGPGICHFAITSACNARCGFCSFARDRLPAEKRHSVTLAEAKSACDILKRNGVKFVHFTGGEPLVHRDGRSRDANWYDFDAGHERLATDAEADRRISASGVAKGLHFNRRRFIRNA